MDAIMLSRLLLILLLASCTKVQYTRTTGTHRMIPEPGEDFDPETGTNTLVETEHDIKFDTNEIMMTDQTGIVCASLMTSMEKSGNAYEAAYKAQRESISGEVTGPVKYSYREHNPAEYRGVECGGYYKWGTGDRTIRFSRPDPLDPSMTTEGEYTGTPDLWEVGLAAGGVGPAFDNKYPWLRVGMHMRAGAGHYELKPDDEMVASPPSGIYITLPIHVEVYAFPELLYGFGISAQAGADPLSWLADAGGVLRQIDFGAAVEYGYGWTWVAVGASAGYERTNMARDDVWVQPSVLAVRAFLQIHLDKIF